MPQGWRRFHWPRHCPAPFLNYCPHWLIPCWKACDRWAARPWSKPPSQPFWKSGCVPGCVCVLSFPLKDCHTPETRLLKVMWQYYYSLDHSISTLCKLSSWLWISASSLERRMVFQGDHSLALWTGISFLSFFYLFFLTLQGSLLSLANTQCTPSHSCHITAR